MAHNANETLIKSAGDVYLATVGTDPPVAADLDDEAALIGDGWTQQGYIAEEGPTFQGFEGEKTVFKVWNVEAAARTKTTVGEPLVNVPFVQWNTDVLPLYFPGASVDGPTGDVVIGNSAGTPAENALLLVIHDGDRTYGFWAARTGAGPGGDLSFPADDLAQLPVAFDVLANDDDSDNMYRWIGFTEAESA